MSVERSKVGMKKRSPTGLLLPNQSTIIINNILFYKIWKKYYEIQLTKNKWT